VRRDAVGERVVLCLVERGLEGLLDGVEPGFDGMEVSA
jgi:hypothetical protein